MEQRQVRHLEPRAEISECKPPRPFFINQPGLRQQVHQLRPSGSERELTLWPDWSVSNFVRADVRIIFVTGIIQPLGNSPRAHPERDLRAAGGETDDGDFQEAQ